MQPLLLSTASWHPSLVNLHRRPQVLLSPLLLTSIIPPHNWRLWSGSSGSVLSRYASLAREQRQQWMKEKYYAVVNGRKPGVYTSW